MDFYLSHWPDHQMLGDQHFPNVHNPRVMRFWPQWNVLDGRVTLVPQPDDIGLHFSQSAIVNLKEEQEAPVHPADVEVTDALITVLVCWVIGAGTDYETAAKLILTYLISIRLSMKLEPFKRQVTQGTV